MLPAMQSHEGDDIAAATSVDAESAAEIVFAHERSPGELERELAALLFASSDPISPARLTELLGGVARAELETALSALHARLTASGLPWELREIAGGWQLFTTPDMAETIASLSRARRDEKVSPAALETLAVVAYRQPVTKAEIEAIRGVQVGPILRALVDRGLVRVAGRSDDPGRALLYVTTRQFLDVFGLASLSDLPRDGELLKD
jgi:segregation and condensation protein B